MKVMPLVRDLRVGADAAGNDTALDRYFIRTSAFQDVTAGTPDVILGPKESGKSAIARQLANPHFAVDSLADVDIIPAFNLEGSILFRKLAQDLAAADESHLQMW